MGKKDESDTTKQLFHGLTFFLSTEVFREPFEFMIIAMGGQVIYDEDNFESDAYKTKSITHVITERNTKEAQSRDYIQPQWVCDSINSARLLPIGDYKVGKALPPHVSPFKDDSDPHVIFGKKGLDIEELKFLHEDEEGAEDKDEDSEEGEEEEDSQAEDDNVREEKFEVDDQDVKKKKQMIADKKEKTKLAEIMLSKKKKRILTRIQYAKKKNSEL